MAVIVVALATGLKGTTTVGLLGVSLNNVLAFSESLSDFLRGWTSLETSLGAIARLRTFEQETEVEEKDGETVSPPTQWPSSGLVEIDNVTAYYGTKKALDSVTLCIQPGQMVAICGRTGSGKSTLLSSFLRTIELSSGSIKVDSQDLSRLSRESIRQCLITVPQESLHLIGTVRFNANPFGDASDKLIISALEKVKLWPSLLERGGLDAELGAHDLSKGQQQLLALARALVRKGTVGEGGGSSKLVLLDEATSSTDAETSKVLHETLRKEFGGSTIIMVAHRREAILSADSVVVMDEGKVVGVGSPDVLMLNVGSRLYALLQRQHEDRDEEVEEG